jgi:hypothetical protein
MTPCQRKKRLSATAASLLWPRKAWRGLIGSSGLAKTALGRHYIEAGEWRDPTQDFGHLGLAERSPASSSRS